MTTLHVQSFGAGRPVVAVHGIYGHGARFAALAGYLPGHAIHAVDLLGHGQSPHLPPWGLAQQIDSVLATMDELDVAEADLVGFSYGGLIAAHLAATAPARVRKLVLMDPAIGIAAADAQRGAANAMAVLSYADRDEARAWRAQSWPSGADEAIEKELREHLVQGDDGRWRWRIQPAAVVVAYSEMARPAIVPAGPSTLLIVATKAGVVRPEYADACRRAGVEVVELESGHQLLLERPDETGAAIASFLAA